MPDLPIFAHTDIVRSRQNPRLKDLRRRMQQSSPATDGLIALEGDHLVEEARRSGLRFGAIFLREDRLPEAAAAMRAGIPTITVAMEPFNQTCLTDSPQGIAALVEAPVWTLESLLTSDSPLLLVLAGLQDPGNVGTILRAAEAFAATGVLTLAGTASPWNQKALRAAAGSSFRMPVVPMADSRCLQRLAADRIPLWACVARDGESLFRSNLRGAAALVIGNEGSGIPDEILRLCSRTIHIPCPGKVESLNAAIAASILLYEASRQRNHASVERS